MTYHRIFSKNNTTCATIGAGTAYPSGTTEFTLFLMRFVLLNLKFSVHFVEHYLLLCPFFWPLYCLSFYDLRLLITPFGIFKLSLYMFTLYVLK